MFNFKKFSDLQFKVFFFDFGRSSDNILFGYHKSSKYAFPLDNFTGNKVDGGIVSIFFPHRLASRF